MEEKITPIYQVHSQIEKGTYPPPMLLTITVNENRSRRRPFQAIKDVFINNLSIIILDLDCRGNIKEWIRYASDVGEQTKLVKKKEQRDKGNFGNRKE